MRKVYQKITDLFQLWDCITIYLITLRTYQQVLSSIYVSRNGLTEAEVLKLASIDWKTWGPIIITLKDHKILIEKCGILTFPFQLVILLT